MRSRYRGTGALSQRREVELSRNLRRPGLRVEELGGRKPYRVLKDSCAVFKLECIMHSSYKRENAVTENIFGSPFPKSSGGDF